MVLRAIERAKELKRITAAGSHEKVNEPAALQNEPIKNKAQQSSAPEFKKIKFPKKSYAGKIWNDRTIKKLIFLILVMNIAILFFSSDYYTKTTKVWDYDADLVGQMYIANFGEAVIRTHIDNLMSRYKANDISATPPAAYQCSRSPLQTSSLSSPRTSSIKALFETASSQEGPSQFLTL